MAQAASNVVDLAAYRAQRAGKCPADAASASVPMIPMVWTFVWVPVWPVFTGHSEAHG